MGQFRGKSGRSQDTGCCAGPWLGPSLAAVSPGEVRKWVTETGSWAGHQNRVKDTELWGRGEAGLEDG